MFEIVTSALGIAVSALYVGYLAVANSIAFWVIVIATFALVIRDFSVELRANARGDRDPRR